VGTTRRGVEPAVTRYASPVTRRAGSGSLFFLLLAVACHRPSEVDDPEPSHRIVKEDPKEAQAVQQPASRERFEAEVLDTSGVLRSKAATRPHGAVPAVGEVFLERTPCFGECPHYEVTVHSDGRVVYVGHENVAWLGSHQGRASMDRVQLLFRAFHLANFLSVGMEDLARQAEGTATCSANVRIGLRWDDKENELLDNQGSYGEVILAHLRALESLVEEVAEVERWVGPPQHGGRAETRCDPRDPLCGL
jgi:hypothetical protein